MKKRVRYCMSIDPNAGRIVRITRNGKVMNPAPMTVHWSLKLT